MYGVVRFLLPRQGVVCSKHFRRSAGLSAWHVGLLSVRLRYRLMLGGLGASVIALASAAAALAAAPVNTAPPAINGVAYLGQTLTATPGTWSNSPTSYSYQWQRCAPADYASAIEANSPAGYWRFEETSTSSAMQDSSGNGDNGSYQGGVVLGEPGGLGSGSDHSVLLDGSSGYGQIPNASQLNPTSAITVEAWADPTAGDFAQQKPIILKSYTSHVTPYYQYGLMMYDLSGQKTLTFDLTLNGGLQSLSVQNTGWKYGVMNYVVGTYDGSFLRLYLNGNLIGTQPDAGATIASYATTLDIGAYANLSKSSSYLFGGSVDDVAVYPTALSAATIAQHYQDGTNTSCSDISGATTASYHVVDADVGNYLQIKVTATNSSGSTNAYSEVGPVTGPNVPTGLTQGGQDGAAPGVCSCKQGGGDPVDTATGSFSETTTDASVVTYGPALSFSRAYDSSLARSQTITSRPGPLGYGWADNWQSSLTTGLPAPSDLYAVAGSGSGGAGSSGDGGAGTSALLHSPAGLATDALGDLYIADTTNNRVQELAATTHTQWGISMTANDIYTIAGSASGTSGLTGDRGAATSALLSAPAGVALDAAGDLYIADTGNSRVQEVPDTSGSQWGTSMTANDIYTVAGSATGAYGTTGNGGLATSALLHGPAAVAVDSAGDLLIADTTNNRVQEVAKTSGTKWGVSMTANDVYTIVGNTSGTSGFTGDSGASTSSLLHTPSGLAVDTSGDLFVSDTANNRVQEIAATTHTQYQISMTANDVYTVAGNAEGTAGTSGDGGQAPLSLLNGPKGIGVDRSGDIYIADTGNNRLQEVAGTTETQWSQAMTVGYAYTIAGTGSSGFSGDGGLATAALLNAPAGVAFDAAGNAYVADQANNEVRELTVGASETFAVSPSPATVRVTLGNGAQVGFVSPVSGACPAPYVGSGASGTYCALPEVTATLTYNSGSSTYTLLLHPYLQYTFDSTGRLTSESGPGGATLSESYGTPSPGSGNCPTAATSCNTVTSASGRSLVIAFNSDGRISAIADPAGRMWDYAYCSPPSSSCSSGDLISVTDPLGHVTSYTYDEPNADPTLVHDLLTITRPNGQAGGPDAGAHLTNVYNASGEVTSQTDPAGNVTTIDYSNLNPTSGNGYTIVTDPDGNKTKNTFSNRVLVDSQSGYGQSSSSTTQVTRDPSTLLDTTVVDPNNHTSAYSYDAAGNTTSSTNQLSETSSSSFNSFDEETCVATPLAASSCSSLSPPAAITPGGTITPPSSAPPAFVTYSAYDTAGNLVWTTQGDYNPGDSSARQQRTTYNLYNGESVTLNGNNDSCTNTAPSSSLPCATINADGVVTQLGYDSAGDLTSSATPDGNGGGEVAKTTYGYDGDGERTSEVAPKGNLSGATTADYTTVTAYNNDGEVTNVSVGQSGGTVTPRQTSYGYDPNGNRTSVTNARNKTTTYTFDANDQPTLVTDPDNQSTLTCYDGDGNVTETVPPVGVAANSLTPSSCPTSYPTGYGDRLASDATTDTFNYQGQKTSETTPAPAGQTGYETTTYSYDAAGNLTEADGPPTSSQSGAPNQKTTYTYDDAGQLLTQTQEGSDGSAASTTSYCYDPAGEKTAIVPPDGNTSGVAACSSSSPYQTSSSYQTGYSYDSLGELVSEARPATTWASGGQTTTYSYDPSGNQLTSQDPKGVTTTKTYTPLNQLATVTYSGSSAPSVSYSYDANGNKVSMNDGTGTSSYGYDPFNELTSYENGASKTVSYSYNADGRTTGITYPLGTGASWASTDTVAYSYDNADELSSVTDFNGNTITVGSTGDGLPNSLALGSGGDTISTTYDPTDSPSQISLANGSSTLLQFAYAKAPSGAIASETDTPSWTGSPANYTYDAQNRVTQMTPGSGSALSYAFDASGNSTTLPTGATGTYDNASELTSSALSGMTTNYTYNADGERTQAVQGTTTTMSATYDGAGRLASYDLPGSSTDMTTAAYDGHGIRQSETTTVSGTPTTANFTWDGTARQPRLLMDSTNAYIYAVGGTPIEQVALSGGTLDYLVADGLGSVRGVVVASGALTTQTAYDAWGNPETSGGVTAYTPFGFAGAYTDPSGLDYLINRYYDPATGQFVTADPLSSQTQKPYTYADDNPVNVTDPAGLITVGECGSLSAFWAVVGGFVSGCLTRVVSGGHDQIGVVGTAGGGLGGGGGVSAAGGIEVSNATAVSQLKKWFVFFSVDISFGVGPTVLVFHNGTGSVFGVFLGVSTGAEVTGYGGFSYSLVHTFGGPAGWILEKFWTEELTQGWIPTAAPALLHWAKTMIRQHDGVSADTMCAPQ